MAARVLEQAPTDAADDDVELLPAPLQPPLGTFNHASTPALGALTKDLLEAQQRYQSAGGLAPTQQGTVAGLTAAAQAGSLADAVQGLSQLVAQAGRCLDRLPEDVEAIAKEHAAWVAARVKDAALLEEEQRCVCVRVCAAVRALYVPAVCAHHMQVVMQQKEHDPAR